LRRGVEFSSSSSSSLPSPLRRPLVLLLLLPSLLLSRSSRFAWPSTAVVPPQSAAVATPSSIDGSGNCVEKERGRAESGCGRGSRTYVFVQFPENLAAAAAAAANEQPMLELDEGAEAERVGQRAEESGEPGGGKSDDGEQSTTIPS
jgi:hypothetical protein